MHADRRPAAARLRANLTVEAAMFEALWRGDASAASRWLASRSTPAHDEIAKQLATGAIALLEGERQTARESLARAESLLARAPLPS